MQRVFDAIDVFFDHLADVDLRPLLVALVLHVVKTMCTGRAWRNVIAASYPHERVRWRSIYAAYLAGIGVNAIVPARSGDVVRLFLARRAVPAATYTTLASTYLVMALFDSSMALLLFGYALTLGVLPGLSVLPSLPAFDFAWFIHHPRASVAIGAALSVAVLALVVWARRRVLEFRARVGQAFAVLRAPGRYVRKVAFWQACDWALRFVAIWFFLDAFDVPQTVRNVLLVQVTASLATLAPVTPGGVGTEQAFLVYVFRGTVGRTALLAFSVGVKIAVTVTNVALGFAAIFLVLRTFRFRRVVGAHEAAEERQL